MKKFVITFSIFLFLSFNILIIPSMAQPKAFKEGFHAIKDLNLSPNSVHTIQNNSPNESVLVILFDSNQIIIQSIRLNPQSEKYILPPIQLGYEMVIIGNGEVTIS